MIVAVVGAGTIGLSWAALFAANGHQVRVTDPRPDLQEVVRAGVTELADVLPGDLLASITTGPDLEAAVTGADVVQENGPERIELKQELFARIEAAAPPHALLLSSTSGLMPSDMGASMREPGRVVVGHPFNPPHVVPLVEVVPGAQTPPETVAAAADFYRSLGKVPVVLHKEIGGFVANRLQSAVFREAVHLVLSGVVTPEELDQVVTESVGVRWATAGPFESYHLGGGPAGIRHLLEHLGPGMVRRWKDLGQPELTEDVVELISSSTEARFADQDYADRTAARDRVQLAVLRAREQARELGQGQQP
ncbi:3-hydroxyacyl-CoA dehydrogenase NAD-binding domain-containing protein [soil metagenome]